ncbi:MAG: lipase secretion chaperone [Desulfobacterales bacterium]
MITLQTEDRQREDEYRQEKEEIQENPDISRAQKQQRIERLREKTFGEDAEAFRRREAIRKAKEERIKEDTASDDPQIR